ncbi:MAG: AAA family ATPase, partial [Kiritimatiellaeota bacterium]|nr:AAA family ATPase [Kiritimatiellota bacterium]
MYLKSLEIQGFKSFAQKTKLVFEPGITAVVGPNGCGKSNISDAIRWVLGEQRPTALRGSAMTDVIFNGTDARPALGMAEVSITFADCEDKLGTDYNEVTVTRRGFRTGEGQYFLNKTACRLRDIHRLFMGTGVGTTSYSVMAQGQIDAILSSRPEDRRAVFEEAAGITRYKADRKEALRKLEQTEANLLRLADVIREVKRQIGSLQRQAGKARRYTEFKTELRSLDTYVTARRIQTMTETMKTLADELTKLDAHSATQHEEVAALERHAATVRETLATVERDITSAMEAAMQAQNRLAQTKEHLRTNEQRTAEYAAWASRDQKEISENQTLYSEQETTIQNITAMLLHLEGETRNADKALADARDQYEARRHAADEARQRLQKLRTDSIERERAAMKLQGELAQAEA